MRSYAPQFAAAGFLLFLALFVAGIARSFTLDEPDLPDLSGSFPSSLSSMDDYRSESRTANNLAQIGLTQTPLPQVLDQQNIAKIQVYEKTAQLASATTAFPEDEEQARKAVVVQKATLFNEHRTGIAPHRKLSLGIAVHPERFDALLRELEQVGHLVGIIVQQQDRTGEFRKLHARQKSLKQHHDAIVKLKEKNKLSVEEELKLIQKIQEIEKDSSAVGVQLGDLLGKDPSYNLFVKLEETQPGGSKDRTFTLGRRIGSALLWAMGWWFLAALGLGLVAATVASVRVLWPTAGRGVAMPPLLPDGNAPGGR